MTTTQLYLNTATLRSAAQALGVPGSADGPPIAHSDYSAALRSAGLPGMAAKIDARGSAESFLEQFGTSDTIVMQGRTASVWRHFLPTVLKFNHAKLEFVDHNGRRRDFDMPPKDVAEYIGWLLALGYEVEIWTPAGNTCREMVQADIEDFQLRRKALKDAEDAREAALAAEQAAAMRLMMSDPAVVVKFGQGDGAIRIMVARWAEAQLMSFQEITAYVQRQWTMYVTCYLSLVSAVLTAVILSVGMVGKLWQAGGMLSGVAVMLGAAGVVSLAKSVSLLWWIRRVRRTPLPSTA